MGAAQDATDFVVLTLGTGVGGGVMSDRRLLRGATGSAAELGHICVYPDGRECGCTKRGCLEAYASSRGILENYRERRGANDLSAEQVFHLAREGDDDARAVLEEAAKAMGIAIGSLVNIFNPERVILAGRISNSFDMLEAEVSRQSMDHAFASPLRQTRICTSPLRERNGIVGAAAVFAYDSGQIENVHRPHIQVTESYPIVAAHVGVSGMRFAVVNLKENMAGYDILSKSEDIGRGRDQEDLLRRTTAGIREVIGQSSIPVANIKGVSIVTPGTVDRHRREVMYPPNMKWSNVKLKEELRNRFPELQAEMFLERDAVAMAMSERFFGQGRGYRNFAVLCLGTGLGAGLVLEGKSYIGTHGHAGELGHTTADRATQRICNCRGLGCLENHASGIALCGYAMNHIKQGKVSSLSALGTTEQLAETLSYLNVLDAADKGDAVAQFAFQEMGEWLAYGIRNLFNTLDLERVIISGPLVRGGKHFIGIVRKTITDAGVLAAGYRESNTVLSELKDCELTASVASYAEQAPGVKEGAT